MHLRVSPEDNRVPDFAPNKPMNSGTAASTAVLEAATAVAAATTAVAAATATAIGCRIGGGKVKSVIPKRRKLVKTMIYHSIKDFLKSLFCPSPEIHNRPKPITQNL